MLTISKFERYDMLNTPGTDKPCFTLWFSGCSMGCPGCHNPRLQDKANGKPYYADTILFYIYHECERLDIDTVTLLGGEPMEQDYNDLMVLLVKLHGYGFKIWLYTGWEFDQIPINMKNYLYVIKSGRYDESLKVDGFPSSSNQKLYRRDIDTNVWNEMTI